MLIDLKLPTSILATTIAADQRGNVYLAGLTVPHGDTYNDYDGTVVRLDGSGGGPVYVTPLAGSSHDEVEAIAVDPSGNVYATGVTSSLDFPVTPNAWQPKHGGGACAFGPCYAGFLAKLQSSGAVVYSTYIGGYGGYAGGDFGYAIALDAASSALVAGSAGTGLQAAVPSTTQGLPHSTSNSAVMLAKFSLPPGPVVTSVTPTSVKQGRATDLAIAGQNLSGALLSVASNSGITITGVQSAAASVSATLNVSPDTPLGSFVLTISTSDGSTATNLLVVADPTLPLISSVVNGASFLPALAPNTWFSIFGTNLGTQEAAQSLSVTKLGGATVSVCGALAALNYNSGAGQINALMPPQSAGQTTCPVVVTVNGTPSPTRTVNVSPQALGIFVFTSGASQLPVATHADYSVVGPPGSGLTPAQPKETIVLWCTGWNSGASTPAVTIGGTNAQVQYYGSSGSTGVCQINVVVPAGLPSGSNKLFVGALGPYALWLI